MFEYTTEGYNKAKEWLKSIGKWEESQRGFSTDGWSVIQFANDLYKRTNK